MSGAHDDPLIGRTIAQYEIVAKLGGGAMGIVYKARDSRLERPVALKFLPPEWSHDDSAKQRFVREAQAASATNHRNICVIHNIEQAENGRLFIVMAYYEGETLKHRLERGPLPVEQVVEIGTEIAEGLARAHSQGVVHRDIKPGNLMLTDDGVKILDFGLAKFADALQLTLPGSSIGTGAYMSPEQVRGDEADARSDLWALGVVLYEMLAGRPPFVGAYTEAIFYAIKHEEAPPLRELCPQAPDALVRVVTMLLEKEPERRFQNAREPARTLRMLAGRTVPLELHTGAVPTPPLPGRTETPSRPRIRRAVQVVAASLALVACVGVPVWWWRGQAAERTLIAIVPVANHTGMPELDRYTRALTYAMSDELGASPNVRVVPYLRLVEIIRPFLSNAAGPSSNDAIGAIAGESGAPFLVVPTLVYRDRDAAWSMRTDVRNATTGATVASYETEAVTSSLSQDTAFRLLAAAAADVQGHFKTHGPGRAFTPRASSRRFHAPEAALAFEAGLEAYEELEYSQALAAFEQSAAADDQHAETHAWVSRMLLIMARKNDAIAAAQRARRVLPVDAGRAEAAFVGAVAAESAGDAAAADTAYRSLVSLTPDDVWARVEYADYLKRRQDRNQEAITAYHEALQRDARFVRLHVDLCQLYTRIDDHPRAEAEAREAIERFRAMGNAGGQAQALLCLGEAEREQGGERLDRAAADVSSARSLLSPAKQPYSLSRAVFYQGLVAFSAGRLIDASRFFEDAAERTHAVGNRVTEGIALMNVGVVDGLLGRPTRALEFYGRSREMSVQNGDERRVAEADTSRAGVSIEFGVDVAASARALANARTNFERLGHVDFQLAAAQSEADAYRYAGDLPRARTVIRAALETARTRDLDDQVASLSASLAAIELQAGNYGSAAAALAPIVDSASGRGELRARVLYGVALGRLGQLDAAAATLEAAREDIQRREQLGLVPLVRLALGDVAVERGQRAEALAHYDAAVSAWGDPLPNAAAAEARCHRAAMAAEGGNVRRGEAEIAQGLSEAERTTHLMAAAACRVDAARIALGRLDAPAALRALEDVPADTDSRLLGHELRARVEYWRAEALARQEAADAGPRRQVARGEIQALIDALPEESRAGFSARPTIGMILRDVSSARAVR